MIVEPLELLGVELRRVARDAVEIECLHEVLLAEEGGLGVLRPSEERQVVHEGLGQDPLLAERLDARRAVTLGQRFPVGPVHLRHVRVPGGGPPERLDHRCVAGRARQEVVAADHVRDLHEHVVDRHREEEDR